MTEPLTFDGVPLTIRPMKQDDEPFVVDSWIMSYRHQVRARDAGHAYLRGHRRAVRAFVERVLMQNGNASGNVACLADSPDTIVGWVALDNAEHVQPIVHYCFVKEAFRRRGVAHALLAPVNRPGQAATFSHRTIHASHIPREWVYDPYAFEIPRYQEKAQ